MRDATHKGMPGGWLLLGVGAVLGLGILALASNGPATNSSSPDRVQAACDQQYGAGSDQSSRCALVALMDYAAKQDAEKQRAAERSAGIR